MGDPVEHLNDREPDAGPDKWPSRDRQGNHLVRAVPRQSAERLAPEGTLAWGPSRYWPELAPIQKRLVWRLVIERAKYLPALVTI